MNKNDIIDMMAETVNISKTEATAALDVFIDCVTSTLKQGGKVQITGFGGFETSKRNARIGRNPQTGVEIQIPATTVAKFKPGKPLRDAVNGHPAHAL